MIQIVLASGILFFKNIFSIWPTLILKKKTYLCICVRVHVCMCTTCMQFPWKPEQGVRSLGTRDGGEPLHPVQVLGTEPRSSKEQRCSEPLTHLWSTPDPKFLTLNTLKVVWTLHCVCKIKVFWIKLIISLQFGLT